MNKPLTCSLTTPELRKRKETVLRQLRTGMRHKKEVADGYLFTFSGDDASMEQLNEFIRTERECCSFFTFGLTVKGDKSEIILSLTGPEGSKDFIRDELQLV